MSLTTLKKYKRILRCCQLFVSLSRRPHHSTTSRETTQLHTSQLLWDTSDSVPDFLISPLQTCDVRANDLGPRYRYTLRIGLLLAICVTMALKRDDECLDLVCRLFTGTFHQLLYIYLANLLYIIKIPENKYRLYTCLYLSYTYVTCKHNASWRSVCS